MNEKDEASAAKHPADRTPSTPSGTKTPQSLLGRRALIYCVSVAVAFLLGFVPMWFTAGCRAKERDVAQRELRLTQVQLSLASAAIDARRGEYEPARLSVVKFFTSLRAEMDRGDDSAISSAQRDAVQPLLDQRDDLVTLLARSDPASAERLANLYVAYRNAMGK